MAQAIHTVERGGFDLMLMTEKNFQTEVYSHNRLGYDVNFLAACPSSARGEQGGVCLVTSERPNRWWIGSTRFHGLNVVSCKTVTRHTWTPVIGAYLPPSMIDHLPDFEENLQ